MTIKQNAEDYLGDGLYVSFDGFQINLRAPRLGGDHYVSLEPQVFRELLRFARRINTEFNVKHFAEG